MTILQSSALVLISAVFSEMVFNLYLPHPTKHRDLKLITLVIRPPNHKSNTLSTMNFHQRDKFSSQWYTFFNMTNFHHIFITIMNFYCDNNEFSSLWWIQDDFYHPRWIFIMTIQSFHQNGEWLSMMNFHHNGKF